VAALALPLAFFETLVHAPFEQGPLAVEDCRRFFQALSRIAVWKGLSTWELFEDVTH